jgi:Ca2+-dependent lipid-binding protein
LNPEWNHEEDFTGYCKGDSITFTVKDLDPAKPDDALEKVVLETSQFFPDGYDGEVPLTEAGSGIEAFIKLKVVVVHPKVRVIVSSAKGLRNADWVGKSDPYCICEVVGKQDVRFATSSVDDNLNPQWNHEAELVGYQVSDALTFIVKDKDPLKPDDILGSVSLPYSSFRNGFDGELNLTETAEGITSTLQVKVEIGDKGDQATKQPEIENQDVSEAASPAAADAGIPQQCTDDPIITADTAPPRALSCFC